MRARRDPHGFEQAKTVCSLRSKMFLRQDEFDDSSTTARLATSISARRDPREQDRNRLRNDPTSAFEGLGSRYDCARRWEVRVMNTGRLTWQLLRVSRWALWSAFLGYCFYVYVFREGQYNQFGHLPTSTELTIFALANAAVFAGLLEMMMRERAGIPRPSYGSASRPDPHPHGRA
jgi:hypothetical protein